MEESITLNILSFKTTKVKKVKIKSNPFPKDFGVVGCQSEKAQKYLNGKAYIISNMSNDFYMYNVISQKLVKLANKVSQNGFHKAVIVERRGKPFIYCLGGYSSKHYGYGLTEIYHVQKNKWKCLNKDKFNEYSNPYTVNGLIDFSIYYYEETDTLYIFGGVFLPDTTVSPEIVKAK